MSRRAHAQDGVTRSTRTGVSRLLSLIAVFGTTLALATAGAAYGFWTTLGTGSGQAQAITLGTPGAGSVTNPTTTSLKINWGPAIGLPTGAGYIVLRSTSGTSGTFTAISAGSCNQSTTAGSTATSCFDTDPSLAPGTTYYYEVESSYVPGSMLLWSSQTDAVFSGTTLSADGLGTLTTTTTSAFANSTGNTIMFTYTAATSGVSGGAVTVAVPTGWTAPVTTNGAGCTTASRGTVSTSGQLITVSGLTLASNGTLTITYGALSGGACTSSDGATATSTTGAQTWQGQEKSTSSGTLTNMSPSPSITVVPKLSETRLASVTNTTAKASSVQTSVATTPGKTDLILIYRESSIAQDSVSSVTGPFASTPTAITLSGGASGQDFSGKSSLFAYVATGNGSGTLTVNFAGSGGGKNLVTVMDVIELSGNNTAQPIVQATFNANSGTSASIALANAPAAGDGEIALIGVVANEVAGVPSGGFTSIDSLSGTTGNGYGFRTLLNTVATSPATSTLTTTASWATIALEIAHQ